MSKTLKKTLSIIIAILMIATTMPFAFAADIVDSGYCGASTNDGGEESVTWTLDSDGLLTISGTGDMTNYSYNGSPFYHNADIKTVVIENGVTSIGDIAFYYCTSLASVTIPDSVTSIGNNAFYDCTSLESITIGNGVTSIGDNAFAYCTNLTSVKIGNSVTSIGVCAFYMCTSLTLIHYLGTINQCSEIEIEIGSNYSYIIDDALFNATRHYCTEKEAIDATCTEAGYTAGWYCADCEEYVVGEETTALGHVDANGDYVCDNGCGYEFEKPATDNVCEDCGKVHTNFFSEIICFFTRIINYIKNLFA